MSYSYTTALVDNAFTYEEYKKDINTALAHKPSNEQEQKIRPYLETNADIMEKCDKSYDVTEEVKIALENAPTTIWLVLTEGWCGDAAFNVPLLAAIEKAQPERVKLKLLLRDKNLELMDAHLTNGGRSIPKLIILSEDLKELDTWGPRPEPLQNLMKGWKSEGLSLQELIPKVHQWYWEDNTRTMQKELKKIIKSYS